jgi:hypothetical protein
MQVAYSTSGKTLSSIQRKANCAASSDASGDASSSYPCPAAAVAAPKARVPASEDEDGAVLIVPDVEGGRQLSASRQRDQLLRASEP